ncbi:MAG: FkbM family methyltransferase [Gammaproteobacteria bacterium]|jgi:FkbM family methyltransferase
MIRLARTVASYIPGRSLLGLRRLRDVPLRLLRRPHDSDFLLLKRYPKDSPVCLDIGANRGQSIESLRAVLKKPSIVAVEPNEMLSGYLDERYDNVKVINCGLGASPGQLKLFMPCYGHTQWDTRTSISEEAAKEFLSTALFAAFQPKRASIKTLMVEVRTLDSLNVQPDIVKIDAEGAEAAILAGAIDTLATLPLILIETVDAAVLDLLEPLGYRGFHIDGKGALTQGTDGGSNSYFLAKKHEAMFLNETDGVNSP